MTLDEAIEFYEALGEAIQEAEESGETEINFAMVAARDSAIAAADGLQKAINEAQNSQGG